MPVAFIKVERVIAGKRQLEPGQTAMKNVEDRRAGLGSAIGTEVDAATEVSAKASDTG